MQALQDQAEWKQLPDETRATVLHAAGAAIAESFKGACVELLDSVAKTQASLSKFRRATVPQTAEASAGATSLEKIQLQLQLDTAEFGTCLQRLLGASAEEVPAFGELQALVRAEGAGESAPGASHGDATAAPLPADAELLAPSSESGQA